MSKRIFSDNRTTELVTNYLRDELIAGNLEPETRIDLDELAQHLDVSRTPIREALLRLEAEGFIERKPYRGAIVASINPTAVEEIYALRIHAEGLAARIGAPRLTDEQLQEMEEALAMIESGGDMSSREFSQLNWRFHSVLYNATDMPLLMKMIEPLSGQAERMRNSYKVFPHDSQVASMHPSILDACRERDGERAEAIMRLHILAAFTDLNNTHPRLCRRFDELQKLTQALNTEERETLRKACALATSNAPRTNSSTTRAAS